MTSPIYLDYAASTPVDPRVAVRMQECLSSFELQGNPSSLSHRFGRAAREVIENARVQVANAVGAKPMEIIWTSGATESNNLALSGAVRYYADRGNHVISSKTEHKAVLEPLKKLEKQGFKVTYLKPDQNGIVHVDQVREAMTPETTLVSLMHVNNEIGVIQDIGAIGALCRKHNVLLHVDAAQSAGRLPIDVHAMNIDLLSCTAHKIYGPKGIGALYVRRNPVVGLEPLIIGGGQELGLRAGTLPTHQIVGFGVAMELALDDRDNDGARISHLRDKLWSGLKSIPQVELNGHQSLRVPNILNVAFYGVEGESLLFALQELILSAGAACSTGSDEASYVLRALGRSDQQAQSSLRFSLGRFTTEQDIDVAIHAVSREVSRLRLLAADVP
ncbi:MAG TPA: aminotransferase class V-fold PLP-dependent enzyme [Steroidobacteraceae bacterium]|nr:aminotransferase class V-fold PLP-dependent enzyme [Steroidobacteraceae bacterium]